MVFDGKKRSYWRDRYQALAHAARELRLSQDVYGDIRSRYPEGHPTREAAGRTVARKARRVDQALAE